jgi:hypothetical protein
MALLISHPDYLRVSNRLAIYEKFLREMHAQGGYWNALPRQVASWWSARAEVEAERHEGQWVIPDLPGARIAHLDPACLAEQPGDQQVATGAVIVADPEPVVGFEREAQSSHA